MTFRSILFDLSEGTSGQQTSTVQPSYFVDLNLDQVMAAITVGKGEYDLKPFFFTPLTSIEEIAYRHEVIRDLEDRPLLEHIKAFSLKMCDMREHLVTVDKLHYKYQKESWFLDAVELYCEAVAALLNDLGSVELKSRGFRALQNYLSAYVNSGDFASLVEEIKRVKSGLAAISYCLLIEGRIDVRRYEGEVDYGAEVQKAFEKFKQGDVDGYRFKFQESAEVNHIEAGVLDFVARLHPEAFTALDLFRGQHSNYLDEVVRVFDREVQFYVAYLDYIAKFKSAGLNFNLPDVSSENKDIFDEGAFDIALADKLIQTKAPTICNDFHLSGQERILVVSGPNQGGKTTFARTFGQLHYLASIGCPVPGARARLFLFDQLFTHFEKEENIHDLRGKLQDDLVRIHEILQQATPRSIIIMNEIFNSTTLKDATFLSKRVLAKIIQLDLLCVCVTFIDELASLSAQTVSMVSTVIPDNPAMRTFRLVRKPADGLAHAVAIAEKYRLTYSRLKERLAS